MVCDSVWLDTLTREWYFRRKQVWMSAQTIKKLAEVANAKTTQKRKVPAKAKKKNLRQRKRKGTASPSKNASPSKITNTRQRKRKGTPKKRQQKRLKITPTTKSPRKQRTPKRTRKQRGNKKTPVQQVSYKYQDPITMEMHQTEVNVPGFVFDTIFKRTEYVLSVDKEAEAYFYLDNDDHPRRSREHLRACTNEELSQASLARLEAEKGEQAEAEEGEQTEEAEGEQTEEAEGEQTQEEEGETDFQVKAPTSWAPFKNQARLAPESLQLMMDELESLVDTDKTSETYYLFVERVARVYINSRRAPPDEDMHENRDHALYNAIRVS
jgi:hypothetical protein